MKLVTSHNLKFQILFVKALDEMFLKLMHKQRHGKTIQESD